MKNVCEKSLCNNYFFIFIFWGMYDGLCQKERWGRDAHLLKCARRDKKDFLYTQKSPLMTQYFS